MVALKGYIVDASYIVEDDGAYVYLYGRLENGESFLTINKYKPYFFIRQADTQKARALIKGTKYENAVFEDTSFKNFSNKLVTKITLLNPKDVPDLRKLLKDEGIESYEADIRFVQRFLMDKDIKMTMNIEGEYKRGSGLQRVDRIYEEPRLTPVADSDFFPELKIISVDIETDRTASELYCIGIYGKNYKKCLIKKPGTYKNAEAFDDEKELLKRFRSIIYGIDPDVIVGWNVVDFDFKIIKELFKKHKLDFIIGRNNKPARLTTRDSFFSDSKLHVPGRAVLDGIFLFRLNYIKMPDLKLSTVAAHYLGEEKLIAEENKGEEIEQAFRHDPQKLIDYNLQDCSITYRVIEKSNVLRLAVKKTMITGVPLERVKSSIASLDSLYLRELRKRGYVAPTTDYSEKLSHIKGGYVMESKPGIYTNVIVLDFKSIYPSIMRTFNIDPLTYAGTVNLKSYPVKSSDFIIAPNGAKFRREEGIISLLIQSLWEKREQAKKRKDDVESYVIKTLMNSFFGVMANPMCRFYNLDVANAITHFGQFFIKMSAKRIREQGYEVIYGDTDSLFINSGIDDYKKSLFLGKQLQDDINNYLKKYIFDNFGLESFMELEFEKVYKKFLMPKLRESETGAKKRYAGILEKDGRDELDFVGMEFVRADWTELSKIFQAELLKKVFYSEDIDRFINEFIQKLYSGKMDAYLIYRKNIRKPLSAYIKTTPPHVQAARKLGKNIIGQIEYIITTDGPLPVEMITKKTKIDYDHYLQKQIKPVAQAILRFIGKNFDDILKKKQTSLLDY